MPNADSLPAQAVLPERRRAARRKGGWMRQAAQILAVLSLAVGSYLVISHFIVGSVEVVGSSMHPTLRNSDRYLLNRWVLHFRTPRRTDIVVVRDPQDHGFSVKRVVGLPGDTISFSGGSVFVNSRLIREYYLPPGTQTYAVRTYACGANQYFLLGDNRNNSIDSRVYGPVPNAEILGLVVQ